MAAKSNETRPATEGESKAVFRRIARARYVLRRMFRIIDECAKTQGLVSLQHQALVQIFGGPAIGLTVNELSERLDTTQPGASRVLKSLVDIGYAERRENKTDLRIIHVRITRAGRQCLRSIERMVHSRIAAAGAELTSEQQAEVLSLVGFYIGLSHWRDL
jgi:DNA-binding MarR family transcriptional regulator